MNLRIDRAELRYAWAMTWATGLRPVVRAAWRRLSWRPRLRLPAAVTPADQTAVAAALGGARPLFVADALEGRALYRLLLPGAAERARRRAENILAHRIERFGVLYDEGARIDWHRDPRSGVRFDPSTPADEVDLLRPGRDPRGPWEIGRAAHLLELGVAARLHADLSAAARVEICEEIENFIAENPVGRGVHWTSPLEVALRVVHWLGALELVGEVPFGMSASDWAFRRRLAGALLEHGRFLEINLEEGGVVANNHLLGDLLGLLRVATALTGLAEAERWRKLVAQRWPLEVERQVLDDGASFEGSTSYHRFVVEMLLTGDRLAALHGLDLKIEAPLGRAFRFLRNVIGPDREEPAFGDSDDGRILPLCAHPPRDPSYLLPLGAVRFGDGALRPPGGGYSEEAVWWLGEDGYRRWRRLRPQSAPASVSFPLGGVHILRSIDERQDDFLAIRCGGHGQRGVGGHSHNDQLSLVAVLGGVRWLRDAGTFCYAADPMWRDRFRGAAAHSTVIINGEEPSPLFDHRPFALPERARAEGVAIEERGDRIRAVGRCRLERGLHRREVVLDRERRAVIVEDSVEGRGRVYLEARFQLGDIGVAPLEVSLREEMRPLVAKLGDRFEIERALLFTRRGAPWALLVPDRSAPPPELVQAWWSPRYGVREPSRCVRFAASKLLPWAQAVALLPVPDGPR